MLMFILRFLLTTNNIKTNSDERKYANKSDSKTINDASGNNMHFEGEVSRFVREKGDVLKLVTNSPRRYDSYQNGNVIKRNNFKNYCWRSSIVNKRKTSIERRQQFFSSN
ncbi:hypothetical protein ABEB36_007816 [Hypothenemus hampei]|uniref:Uncharacterized protein n=1 Tax=Hypothenemus hampei TaxID=57062 RepID=A0ABD1EYC1_HYPHA